MASSLLPTLRRKREVDAAIRNTLDKVLVLRFGRAADAACLHLDDILAKSSWDISKFATVALVDMDFEEIQVYIDYFDITLVPATIFFFNAHHMKMDSGTPNHTKWIGSFSSKQDFIDMVEVWRVPMSKGHLQFLVELSSNKCNDERTYGVDMIVVHFDYVHLIFLINMIVASRFLLLFFVFVECSSFMWFFIHSSAGGFNKQRLCNLVFIFRLL